MKHILPLFFVFTIQQSAIAQNGASTDPLLDRVLSKEKMQADFRYLRQILEDTHPALYRYTPRNQMQQKMDSLAHSLDHDMAFYEYYQLLASLIADIHCAHTYIIPRKDFRNYSREIKTLPLEIIPLGTHLYITLNGTTDTIIQPGYEILAINKRPVEKIMQQFSRYIWADGHIESSKIAQLTGTRFGFFYYIMIERPDSFLLRLRDLTGKEIEVKLPALPNNVYQSMFFKNPVNKTLISLYKEKNRKDQQKGWRLEMLNTPHTALLRINAFGGGDDDGEAAKKMRQFMEKNITALNKNNIQHLIVDIRNNGGGWDTQGVELFTYLMKDTTPVRYYRRQHSIIDSSAFLKFSDLSARDKATLKDELIPERDGTFTLKEEYNMDLKPQHPKPHVFSGNIYFLINGATGSSASEFAAVAHSNALGSFIGEETGGAYEGDNGGSFLHFELPNTGIALGTPLIYYDNEVKPPLQKGRGVIPDYPVLTSLDDLLHAKDTQLEFALELIRKMLRSR